MLSLSDQHNTYMGSGCIPKLINLSVVFKCSIFYKFALSFITYLVYQITLCMYAIRTEVLIKFHEQETNLTKFFMVHIRVSIHSPQCSKTLDSITSESLRPESFQKHEAKSILHQ